MDKKAIVKELLARGQLPTPDLVDRMMRGQVVQTHDTEPSNRRIEVRILSPERKERMDTRDFTSFYNSKYEGLRSMIMPKIEAVSIKRAAEVFGDVGVIGMVRERTQNGFIIEDTTGAIPMVTTEHGIETDDVIGVSGQMREKSLFGKMVVWPDIPLSHRHGSIPEVRATFSHGQQKDDDDPNHTYFSVDGERGRRMFSGLPNGSMIYISDGRATIRILFYSPVKGAGVQECVASLRKRHLSVVREDIVSHKDEFIMTEVPDILWVNADTRFVESYKGVVIISPGKETVTLDLGTKQVS